MFDSLGRVLVVKNIWKSHSLVVTYNPIRCIQQSWCTLNACLTSMAMCQEPAWGRRGGKGDASPPSTCRMSTLISLALFSQTDLAQSLVPVCFSRVKVKGFRTPRELHSDQGIAGKVPCYPILNPCAKLSWRTWLSPGKHLSPHLHSLWNGLVTERTPILSTQPPPSWGTWSCF